MINIQDVSVKLQNHTILEAINMHITQDDFICLIGANGSGKTTLLKAISG